MWGAGRPDRPLAVAGAAPGGVRRVGARLGVRRPPRAGGRARRVRGRARARVARAVGHRTAQARGRRTRRRGVADGDAAGVANTLVHDDGRWRADNTDVPGAVAALRERWSGRSPPRPSWAGARPRPRWAWPWPGWARATIRLLVRDPRPGGRSRGRPGPASRRPGVEVASLHDAGRRRGRRVDRPGRRPDRRPGRPLCRRTQSSSRSSTTPGRPRSPSPCSAAAPAGCWSPASTCSSTRPPSSSSSSPASPPPSTAMRSALP